MGKTSFAVVLAKLLKCPILSSDARQFYKEMNIGTAVPSKNELSKNVVCRKHMLSNPEMRFPIIHNSRNKMQSSTDQSSADANLKNAEIGDRKAQEGPSDDEK